MKKIVFLSMFLLTIGFSQDLFESGLEAYKKGDYSKQQNYLKKLVMEEKFLVVVF